MIWTIAAPVFHASEKQITSSASVDSYVSTESSSNRTYSITVSETATIGVSSRRRTYTVSERGSSQAAEGGYDSYKASSTGSSSSNHSGTTHIRYNVAYSTRVFTSSSSRSVSLNTGHEYNTDVSGETYRATSSGSYSYSSIETYSSMFGSTRIDRMVDGVAYVEWSSESSSALGRTTMLTTQFEGNSSGSTKANSSSTITGTSSTGTNSTTEFTAAFGNGTSTGGSSSTRYAISSVGQTTTLTSTTVGLTTWDDTTTTILVPHTTSGLGQIAYSTGNTTTRVTTSTTGSKTLYATSTFSRLPNPADVWTVVEPLDCMKIWTVKMCNGELPTQTDTTLFSTTNSTETVGSTTTLTNGGTAFTVGTRTIVSKDSYTTTVSINTDDTDVFPPCSSFGEVTERTTFVEPWLETTFEYTYYDSYENPFADMSQSETNSTSGTTQVYGVTTFYKIESNYQQTQDSREVEIHPYLSSCYTSIKERHCRENW